MAREMDVVDGLSAKSDSNGVDNAKPTEGSVHRACVTGAHRLPVAGETDVGDGPLAKSDSKAVDNAKPTEGSVHRACVTGAGGFIAAWLVKRLLDKGYVVVGTLRNPDDPKNAHLSNLVGAAERLTLVKCDLMDFESLASTMKGCHAVFHLASPITDNPVEMVEPAVRGTLNVLDAALQAGVSRVVFTSSIGAVNMDPHRDPGVVVDESCWSDLDYCKATKNWYCYGKAVAEKAAWDFAKAKNLDMVVLIPSLVLGPLLQSSVNTSTMHILKYVTGSAKTYVNSVQAYVDVRDVAETCLLLYETASASGRYFCAESVVHRGDLCDILAELFPQYPVPRKCSDQSKPRAQPFQFSNEKLRSLGHSFIPLRKSAQDTVLSLQKHNIIRT